MTTVEPTDLMGNLKASLTKARAASARDRLRRRRHIDPVAHAVVHIVRDLWESAEGYQGDGEGAERIVLDAAAAVLAMVDPAADLGYGKAIGVIVAEAEHQRDQGRDSLAAAYGRLVEHLERERPTVTGPRVFAPVVIPADVTQVRTEAGVVWERIPSGTDLWQRPDQPAVGRGWITTTQLLLAGQVTEVVPDGQ